MAPETDFPAHTCEYTPVLMHLLTKAHTGSHTMGMGRKKWGVYAQPEWRWTWSGFTAKTRYTLRIDSNMTSYFMYILSLSKGCNNKILFIRHGEGGNQSLWESKMFTSGVCHWELGLNVRMDSRQPTAWLKRRDYVICFLPWHGRMESFGR